MEDIIKKLNDAGVNIDDLVVVDATSSTVEICLEVNTPETDKLKEEIAERVLFFQIHRHCFYDKHYSLLHKM